MNNDLNAIIDQLLSERRPDRYEKDGGDSWLDEVALEIEALVPDTEAKTWYATKAVRDREKQKTKSANKAVRDVRKNAGQLVLGWLDTLNLPLAVGKWRVALRAARVPDFREFAIEERRRAANDFSARNETCEAAEWIADQMLANGIDRFGDYDPGT